MCRDPWTYIHTYRRDNLRRDFLSLLRTVLRYMYFTPLVSESIIEDIFQRLDLPSPPQTPDLLMTAAVARSRPLPILHGGDGNQENAPRVPDVASSSPAGYTAISAIPCELLVELNAKRRRNSGGDSSALRLEGLQEADAGARVRFFSIRQVSREPGLNSLWILAVAIKTEVFLLCLCVVSRKNCHTEDLRTDRQIVELLTTDGRVEAMIRRIRLFPIDHA